MEGVFDREEPKMRGAAEEMSMAHSAAMVQRLLMNIESLEHQVHLSSPRPLLALTAFTAQSVLPVVPRIGAMFFSQSSHRRPPLQVHA